MAVDTRRKRMSASNAANPFARLLPLADGTIDQADRQHAAGYYSGILATALVTVSGIFITLDTIMNPFVGSDTIINPFVGRDTIINPFISEDP